MWIGLTATWGASAHDADRDAAAGDWPKSIPTTVSPRDERDTLAPERAQILAAIEQLGSPHFEQRAVAQRTLLAWGAAAWEALQQAQADPDLEISIQARYLMQRLLIVGPDLQDPPETHELLHQYATLHRNERMRRIDRLAQLEPPAVAHTLVRIVQYEQNEIVSLHAAIALLRRDAPRRYDARVAAAERISHSSRHGTRRGLVWLRAYAQTLIDPRAAQTLWPPLLVPTPELGDDEQAMQRQLMRWYSEAVLELGDRRTAESVMLQLVQGLPRDPTVWLDTLDWLTRFRGWSAIEDLTLRCPLALDDPYVAYRIAAAATAAGEFERAHELVRQIQQRPATELTDAMELGAFLTERALFDWAQFEYERAWNLTDVPAYLRIYLLDAMASLYRAQGKIAKSRQQYETALQLTDNDPQQAEQNDAFRQVRTRLRIEYSEMLHDNSLDREAAEVLQPLSEPTEEWTKEVEQWVDEWELTPAARREFFLAEHARSQQDRSTQLAHLTLGFQHDPHDVDLLIAMYRFENPPDDWQVRAAIRDLARKMRSDIADLTKTLERTAALTDNTDEEKRLLASELNVYAWLVGNTEGDYQDALRCSSKSLELRPNQAGYLDTQARCYFSLERWEDALRTQERAVELDAHSGQMNRQLAEFQRKFQEHLAATEQ